MKETLIIEVIINFLKSKLVAFFICHSPDLESRTLTEHGLSVLPLPLGYIRIGCATRNRTELRWVAIIYLAYRTPRNALLLVQVMGLEPTCLSNSF